MSNRIHSHVPLLRGVAAGTGRRAQNRRVGSTVAQCQEMESQVGGKRRQNAEIWKADEKKGTAAKLMASVHCEYGAKCNGGLGGWSRVLLILISPIGRQMKHAKPALTMGVSMLLQGPTANFNPTNLTPPPLPRPLEYQIRICGFRNRQKSGVDCANK